MGGGDRAGGVRGPCGFVLSRGAEGNRALPFGVSVGAAGFVPSVCKPAWVRAPCTATCVRRAGAVSPSSWLCPGLSRPGSVCSLSPAAPRATIGSSGCSITLGGGARGPRSKSVLHHPQSLGPGREQAPRTQPCSGVHSSSLVIFHLASLPRSHQAVPVLPPALFPPHAEGRSPPEQGLTCPVLPRGSIPPSREDKGWGFPSAPQEQDEGLCPFPPKPPHARGAGKRLWSILKAWPLPWNGEVEERAGCWAGLPRAARSTGGAGEAQRGVGQGGEATGSCSRCCAASWQCSPLP